MKSSEILRAKFTALSVLTTVALLGAPASAQTFQVAVDGSSQSSQPTLKVKRIGSGVAVVVSPGTAEPGLLILIGAFDPRMASLGKGLPDVLVQSQIVAFAWAPAERISVSAPWPPLHVYLQAVEVDLESLRITASAVQQIGSPPANYGVQVPVAITEG